MSTYFADLTSSERVRLGILAFILGPAILLGAGYLFYTHERDAARLSSSLREGAASVVETSASEADPAMEGRLVHLTGDLRADGMPRDPQFDVTAPGVCLLREVRIYEWREHNSSDKRTTYHRYDQGWERSLQNSSAFYEPAGHRNPARMAYEPARFDAREVRLGAYVLDPRVTVKLTDTEAVRMEDGHVRLPPGAKLRYHDEIYLGSDPNNPAVGDLRITERRVAEGPASVVAAVRGGRFIPYHTRSGEDLALAQKGTVAAAAMFDKGRVEGSRFIWLWRGATLVGLYPGLAFVLDLLILLNPVFSFFDRVARRGVLLVGLPGTAALGLLLAAVAWLPEVPLVGGALLVAAVLVAWMLTRMLPGPPAGPAPPGGGPPEVEIR